MQYGFRRFFRSNYLQKLLTYCKVLTLSVNLVKVSSYLYIDMSKAEGTKYPAAFLF
jgi:hypothetical protein